jgi:hypothetical protein
MKIPRLNAVEFGFIALIVFSIAMRVHDVLPASSAEIASVQAEVRSNEDAAPTFAAAIAADPGISKGHLRRLHEQIVRTESEEQRLSHDASARELADEGVRLAGVPFWQMTFDDKLRWLLVSVGRHITLILGSFVGLCTLVVVRKGGGLRRSRA